MKIKNLLIIPFCLFLSFCSSSPEPKDVAQQLLTHFENYEFEKAKALSTPDFQKALDHIARKMTVRKNAKKGDYKITDEVTQGDLSSVEFESEEQHKLKVKLTKTDGKWLVANIED